MVRFWSLKVEKFRKTSKGTRVECAQLKFLIFAHQSGPIYSATVALATPTTTAAILEYVSHVEQCKSINISMTVYPIETNETPKERPHCALQNGALTLSMQPKPMDQPWRARPSILWIQNPKITECPHWCAPDTVRQAWQISSWTYLIWWISSCYLFHDLNTGCCSTVINMIRFWNSDSWDDRIPHIDMLLLQSARAMRYSTRPIEWVQCPGTIHFMM